MAPEEKNGAAHGGKTKARWGFMLLLLFAFLGGGGFYALNSMKDAAQRLAADANNGELSDDSLYSPAGRDPGGREAVFPAQDGAAPGQAQAGSSLNAKLKPGWVKEMLAEQERASSRTQGATTAAGGGADQERGGGGAAAAGQSATDAAFGARLQARPGMVHGGQSAKASRSVVGGMESSGAQVGLAAVQRETDKKGTPKKGGRGGVMEALKSAFRASFYGARIASQDAAKDWVSKAFDATPEATTSIEYDDKMKAKLDVVNPNSIPKFLREQDVSAAEAKTLTAAKVTKPEVDKDGTKKALQEDKGYQAKNMGKQLGDGVLNGLFSGVAKSESEDGDDYARTGDGAGTLETGGESPMALQSLYQTDEYGNTSVPCGDGLTCIFGQDGGILGCEDPNAGMCLIAGASDQCSSDMTLSDFTGGT